MRAIMFFASEFAWSKAQSGDEEAQSRAEDAVVVFLHAEPGDDLKERKTVARFLKQVKQIARKWETKKIVIYPFSHLGEEKAEKEVAEAVVEEIVQRLKNVGYEAMRTQFGSFVNFSMTSPGAPLSRAYRQF